MIVWIIFSKTHHTCGMLWTNVSTAGYPRPKWRDVCVVPASCTEKAVRTRIVPTYCIRPNKFWLPTKGETFLDKFDWYQLLKKDFPSCLIPCYCLANYCGSLTAGVFGTCRNYRLLVVIWLSLLHPHSFAVVFRKSSSLKTTRGMKGM